VSIKNDNDITWYLIFYAWRYLLRQLRYPSYDVNDVSATFSFISPSQAANILRAFFSMEIRVQNSFIFYSGFNNDFIYTYTLILLISQLKTQ